MENGALKEVGEEVPKEVLECIVKVAPHELVGNWHLYTYK